MSTPKTIRVYRCQAHGCMKVMKPGDRWIVAVIDADGRLIFEPHRDYRLFAAASERHGARVLCGEACAYHHLQRWLCGMITAADKPFCPSPAAWNGNQLTCWVSDVYETTTAYGPARIINYRDSGRKCTIFCFRKDQFESIDRTAGGYATFLTETKINDGGRQFCKVSSVLSWPANRCADVEVRA
ncbi:MAG TPA: hypothetical protein VGQ12_08015 [Candidatus Angelobacter sp.]|jgi:hypothetical protein|nr:hypothetical protein [Candidatus Angelobacter sp.]